jgi:hypothetical protein
MTTKPPRHEGLEILREIMEQVEKNEKHIDANLEAIGRSVLMIADARQRISEMKQLAIDVTAEIDRREQEREFSYNDGPSLN